MKKELFSAFAALVTFVSYSQTAPTSRDRTPKPPIQTLVVDLQSLPFEDRVLIAGADIVSNDIDSNKSLHIFRGDTTVNQGAAQSKASYTVYYNHANGVSKIETRLRSSIQDAHYVFYFRFGKVVKIVSENFEDPPFKSIVYFVGTKSFFPGDFSERTIIEAKKDAQLLYDFFTKGLVARKLL